MDAVLLVLGCVALVAVGVWVAGRKQRAADAELRRRYGRATSHRAGRRAAPRPSPYTVDLDAKRRERELRRADEDDALAVAEAVGVLSDLDFDAVPDTSSFSAARGEIGPEHARAENVVPLDRYCGPSLDGPTQTFSAPAAQDSGSSSCASDSGTSSGGSSYSSDSSSSSSSSFDSGSSSW